MPPVTGRINWSRQLLRRIRDPMDAFEQCPQAMKSPEARKVIKNFNQLAKVLTEYEMLYHRAWVKQIEPIKSGKYCSE